METKTHVFAHLGPAPYRYTGVSQNIFSIPGCPEATKPGGSCGHCGTGISLEFHFTAANGRKFKVGSSCVDKAGDAGLKRDIAQDVRDHQRKLREARAAKKREVNAVIVAAQWPAARGTFAAQPHPNAYYASQGKTLADYLEYCGHEAMVSRMKKESEGDKIGPNSVQW